MERAREAAGRDLHHRRMDEGEEAGVVAPVRRFGLHVRAEGGRIDGHLLQPHEGDLDALAPAQLRRRLARVRREAPRQHHAVAQPLVAAVALQRGDGLREAVDLVRRHARRQRGPAHPHGHTRPRPLVAVDTRVRARHARVVAVQHEGAELIRRHLRQLVRLVDAPVLNVEIGDGRVLQPALGGGVLQALGGDGDGDARLVNSNPTAAQTLRHGGGRATTHEGIKHQIALIGGCCDDAFEQLFWFLRGVSNMFC